MTTNTNIFYCSKGDIVDWKKLKKIKEKGMSYWEI